MKNTILTILLLLSLGLAPTNNASANDTLSLSDARHLITRTGLGASPTELNQYIGLSRTAAVNRILKGLTSQPSSAPPAWIKNPAPHHYRFGTMSSQDKQKFRRARMGEIQSLRRWWVQEMISTPSPQAERLVLFWHNHFATSYSALNNQVVSLARQHMMLREHSAGNFRAFLKSIIRDPAMLNYLDNNNSKKQKPNENLAREILELFTLGEGNYTESDIKNAARALTGYSYAETYDMRFVFKQWTHDAGEKELFGRTGKFDGDDLIDLILEQPATARFITAKLWRILVGDIDKTNDKLTVHANAFRSSDYEIKTLYRSILLSEDFWHPNNRATIVQSPVSLAIGAIRSTGILPSDWQTLPSRLEQMGQFLFEPPNVAGWPGGASWIAPGRLLARLEWLEQLGRAKGSSQNNSMSNMATMMNSQDQSTSMIAPTGGMMNTAMEDTQLAIRMAAEEFDEHVRYLVKVYGLSGATWESGERELIGGHDTKTMGRVQKNKLPWQTIKFPVDIAADEVTAIEVSFINDDATPDGADRNLYISHASLGDRVWLPRDGEQTGKCARKKPAARGFIYCPGKLRMEKSLTTVNDSYIEPTDSNTIRASSTSLLFVRPVNNIGNGTIVFTLSDVEFGERFWNTVNVKYLKHKEGYALRMNSFDCWPQCVIRWPECAWDDPYSNRTISVELNGSKPCMYDDLQEPDKKLINALWMLLDDLYETESNSPKLQRPNIERNYKIWKPLVYDMLAQLPSSPFNEPSIKLEIAPRPIVDVTVTEQIEAPQPAGMSHEQREASLNELRQREPELNIVDLLLPAKPIDVPANAELVDVITDLAFQLK